MALPRTTDLTHDSTASPNFGIVFRRRWLVKYSSNILFGTSERDIAEYGLGNRVLSSHVTGSAIGCLCSTLSGVILPETESVPPRVRDSKRWFRHIGSNNDNEISLGFLLPACRLLDGLIRRDGLSCGHRERDTYSLRLNLRL